MTIIRRTRVFAPSALRAWKSHVLAGTRFRSRVPGDHESMWVRRGLIPGVLLIALAVGSAFAWWWNSGTPMERGVAAYRRGDWKTASNEARRALNDSPRQRDALRLLARAQARQGRLEPAMQYFERLGSDAMDAEDWFLAGQTLLAQGLLEPARTALDHALERDPNQAEALETLVKFDTRSDRLFEAMNQAKRLAEVPGWEARGLALVGMLHAELSDPAQAAAAFESALTRDPDLRGFSASPLVVRKDLARALLALRRPTDAEAHIKSILAKTNDAEAHWLLSRVALQQGEGDRASAELERAREYSRLHADPREPAPYVGAARCASCHREIARAQQGGHHAMTFLSGKSLGELALPEGEIPDPHNQEVVHELKREGGHVALTTRVGNETLRALADYALGSDCRALTMVGRDQEGVIRELRMSHYHEGPPWDMTTGHETRPSENRQYLGRRLSRDMERQCLGCHTTCVPQSLSQTGPAAADGGIGCERCHGPGGNHLAAVNFGSVDLAIGRPRLLSHEQSLMVCAPCHSPRTQELAIDDPLAVRFPGATFPMSRCYTESERGLSCTTCHDPHRDVETDVREYEAVCLSCHSSQESPSTETPRSGVRKGRRRIVSLPAKAKRVACPVEPRQGCVSCHMPKVTTNLGHNQRFSDHRIRVHPRTGMDERKADTGDGRPARRLPTE